MKLFTAALLLLAVTLFVPVKVEAQFQTKWLSVGSLHNWYISTGTEREHGLVNRQQFGLRWPAIYQHQDSQAAKGFWIGTKNFTDENGTAFPTKVVHVGPRVSGSGSVFPLEMNMISQFAPPEVYVDGIQSFQLPIDNDEVDPDLPADRMIYNLLNTAIGLQVERKIMQFSNQFHDNYHVSEYTFTNTGNVNENENIELPNQTLEDVYFFFQYRYSVNQSTRYTIGNSTGWGINTMINRRGDGLRPEEPETFRAQYIWHGRYPAFTTYDNLGGPIWSPNTSGGFVTADDTTGRLGAYQFVGHVVLHADTSPDDPTDDPNQPRTMSQMGSDDPLNSGNDPFNLARMAREYDLMTAGRTTRHAYIVEPNGNFTAPTGDPSLGTSGGWSATNGFGPYTIGPGESVKIVLAEAMAGINREASEYIGRMYKQSGGDNNALIAYDVAGVTHELTKNEWVFTGEDSLFQTFNRAIANYQSGYNIPRAPRPPSLFNINGGGDGIYMTWDYDSAEEANVSGFEIYRADTRTDSTYYRVFAGPPSSRSFVDDDSNPVGGPTRGRNYYYYITALGDASANNGGGLTPQVALRSSRYYTQSYDPARLKRPAGEAMSEIVIVPNPYIRNASGDLQLDEAFQDRIAFYEIPGRSRIKIYTELGELIKTIEHSDGSGDAFWDMNTEWRQKVVSGVYIAVIENLDDADPEFGKQVIKKFVVVI
ncbi:MAG: hypothetical protein LC662_12855 [Rhodothermaceae bacterium]|nr:hypothetical protein [Rhodothermaceae bacterium]